MARLPQIETQSLLISHSSCAASSANVLCVLLGATPQQCPPGLRSEHILWSQDLAVADLGVYTPRRYEPTDYIFYVDERCAHVAEVLVHSWLNMHRCAVETCVVGELLVGSTSEGPASLPRRVLQEIEDVKPVDLLQVIYNGSHENLRLV